MATSVTFNGSTYSIPANREPRGWGTSLSSFLVDVANSSLSKAGGNFTLTADANFGSNYGLVAKYIKSVSSNIAASGVVRLANNEGVAWRNAANSADLMLKVDAGNRLEIDGVDIVTVSSTDTLTNKTLTSPVINTPTGIVKGDVGLGNVDNTSDANKPVSTAQQAALDLKANLTNPTFDDGITMLHESTPSTPSSGRVRVYPKSDNNLYLLDSSGVETAIGSGGGSGTGSLNIVDNPSAASSTTGWTAATNYTVTRDTTNSPLAGVIDSCFAISTTTASSETSTSGVYAASLAMPSALRNSKVQGNLWVTVPATSAGVWRLSVYNASGTRMTLDRDSSSVFTLPGGYTGQLPFTFDADSSATYTISFTQTTRSSANTLYATLISIGNGNVSQTFPGGEIALTSSVIGATNSSAYTNTTITNCVGQRVGSWLVVTGKLSFTGLPATGTGALVVRLSGTGLNIDSTKSQNWSGGGVFYDASASGAIYNLSPVPYMTSTNIDIQFTVSGDTASTTALNPASAPVAFANGDLLTFDIRIPIAEWAGSVNTAPVPAEEFASGAITSDANTTTTVYGQAGSRTPTASLSTNRYAEITWLYPRQQDDEFLLEVDTDGNGAWLPHDANSFGSLGYVAQNTTAYGMYLTHVSASVSRVYFAVYAYPNGATYGSAGAPWSGSATMRYRVRKTKKASLPFANAGTDGSAGLYKAGQAPGLTTGATIGAGYVGQEIIASRARSSASGLTTITQASIVQIDLTAGSWLLSSTVGFTGTATATTQIRWGLNTSSVATPGATEWDSGLGGSTSASNNLNNIDFVASTRPVRVDVSGATTYYLNVYAAFSGGTCNAYGQISAIRKA